MGSKSKIGWTDATWNPVTGCTRVSAGCEKCYAERMAFRIHEADYARWSKADSPRPFDEFSRYAGVVDTRGWTHAVRCHPDLLDQPLRWRKPRRIFVCSMSDLFHEGMPDAFLDRVFATMAWCSGHRFQLLSKRAGRLAAYLTDSETPERIAHVLRSQAFTYPRWNATVSWPLPNVWLGVSVENRAALSRVELLRQVPAAVRWISFEPLLEDLGDLDLAGVSWAVIGGESGPGYRQMKIDWLRDIVTQCQAAEVPVWVKQDSALHPGTQGRIPDALWALKEFPRGDL